MDNHKNKLHIAKTLLERGLEKRRYGDYTNALKSLNEAAKIFLNNNEKRGYAICMNSVAVIYSQTGKPSLALSVFEKLIPVSEEIKDEDLKATILGNIGLIYMELGEFENARAKYKESLKIFRKLGAIKGIANQYGNLGLISLRTGKIDDGERELNQALFYFESINARSESANCLNCLGEIKRLKGEIDEAKRLFSKSLKLFRELGIDEGVALTLKNLANLEKNECSLKTAKEKVDESYKIYRKTGNISGMASSLTDLGNISLDEGEIKKGKKLYFSSLRLNKKSQNLPAIAGDLTNIGNAVLIQGKCLLSLNYFNKALKIYKDLSMEREEKILLLQITGINSLLGKYEESLKLLENEIKKVLNFPVLRSIFLSSIAEIEWKIGLVHSAFNHIREAEREFLKHKEIQRYLMARLFEAEINIKFCKFSLGENIINEVEAFSGENNLPFHEINLLITRGSLLYEKSSFNDSAKLFSQAGEKSKKIEFKILELASRTREAESLCEGGIYEKVGKEIPLLLKDWQRVKIPSGIYDCMSIYGDYLISTGNLDEGEKLLKKTLIGVKKLKLKVLEGETLFRLGKVFYQKDIKSIASEFFSKSLKIYKELNFTKRIEKLKKIMKM